MAITKLINKLKAHEEEKNKKLDEDHSSGQQSHDDGEGNWLVSYADMMTLLCGFFIMMFSMSKLDEPKYEVLKEALAKQFGGQYTPPPSQIMGKLLTHVLQETGLEQETTIASDTVGVTVAFQSKIFFETLSAEILPGGRAILEKLIDAISKRQMEESRRYKIVVEGHTDGRPILSGTFPTNWELSGSRAARVVRIFLEKGFSPDRLSAIAYADTQPEIPFRTSTGEWDESALTKNRRVVIRILEPNTEAIPYPTQSANPAH